MDFPDSANRKAFESFLKQGLTFRLKGEAPFPSEKLHIFVVINYDPKAKKALLLVNGTSKVEKRYGYLEKAGIDANKTTVLVKAGSYSYTPKDTLFDCNSVHEVNLESISFRSDRAKLLGEPLSKEHLSEIISAVKASPRVSQRYKEML